MRLSLRIQQTALFVAVILVAVLLLSWWVFTGLRAQLADAVVAEQLKDASAVAVVLGPYFPASQANAAEMRDHVRQFAEVLDDDVRVYDPEGTRLDGRERLAVPEAVLSEARTRALRDGSFARVDFSSPAAVVAASPIRGANGDPVGVAVVADSAAVQRRMLDTLLRQLTVADVSTILLAGLLGYAFSEVITRNTKRLITAANDIASGHFSRRMPQGRLPEEIGRLVDAFNRMAEQLGEAFDTLKGQEAAQRQFVANASHELRTPIAALKGAIEILESGAKERPDARDEFLTTMRVEVNRLQRLVDNLFTLAQVDSGRLRLQLHPEPAAEIVRVVTSSMRPLANEAGVAIESDAPDDGMLALCDRDYVTQVLVGFVDNAIKHTPAGGVVTVALRADGSRVGFCVKDTGGGIPQDVLPHIFDRFYTQRKSAEGGHRGSGLGLAIAHEIVEAHGSDIDVRSTPGEGTSFCFSLERTEAPALLAAAQTQP